MTDHPDAQNYLNSPLPGSEPVTKDQVVSVLSGTSGRALADATDPETGPVDELPAHAGTFARALISRLNHEISILHDKPQTEANLRELVLLFTGSLTDARMMNTAAWQIRRLTEIATREG